MSPFKTLTLHFFDRFFDQDSISSGADPKTNVIQMLSLLAMPGLLLSFFVMMVGSRHFDAGRFFHVSYSMVAMGFAMVLKWDSLFPDVRDYLILGSLPIRYVDLFVGKLVALFLFIGIFAIDISLFSTLMVPPVNPGPYFQSLLAHVAAVFGGALFMALGFAGLQGVLINVLPHHVFRRFSPVFQMVSITTLLTILLIHPLLSASIQPLAQRSSPLLQYFPMFWFLGLYEWIAPYGNGSSVFQALALKSVLGLAIVSGIFALTYGIAYRRHARSIVEAADPGGAADESWRHRFTRRYDRLLGLTSAQLACFRFTGSILTRSAKHQVFLAIYGGVGLALALSTLFSINPRADFPFQISHNGMLELPLILAFFVVSGLRATFNIPYELPANWMFRLTDSHTTAREYVSAVRKWVVLYGVVPLMTVMAAVEFSYWPAQDAVFYLVFETMVSLVLLQVFFFSFRKVPFTCSYYPGKINMAFLSVIYLYGFTTYASSMVELKRWLSTDSLRKLLFVLAGSMVLLGLSAIRRRRDAARIIYEEQPDPLVRTLGLN